MNYRNARLANGFLSLDQLAGEIDLVKSRVVSDGGTGVERIVRMIDCSETTTDRRSHCKTKRHSTDGEPRWLAEEREAAAERQRKFHAAETRLRRLGLGYLVSTLALICKNGKDREVSIREIASRRHLCWEAAKARYFAHREKIEKIFLGQ